MTNMAVELALRAQGIELVRAKVGDRYVLEELEKRGWILGGEGSGHLLALDRHSTGDGVISALSVLAACVRAAVPVAVPGGFGAVPAGPDQCADCPRLRPGRADPAQRALRAVEAELGDTGRVLVRASGTEPLLRVMVEARDAAQARACAQRLADACLP
jgi:phosphoglucosamine mutase